MLQPEQKLPFISSETEAVQKWLKWFSTLCFTKSFFFSVYHSAILPSGSTAEGLVLVGSSSEIVIKPTAQTAIIYSHLSIKAQNKRWSGCGDRQRQRKLWQKNPDKRNPWSAYFEVPFSRSPCKHISMKSKLSRLRARRKSSALHWLINIHERRYGSVHLREVNDYCEMNADCRGWGGIMNVFRLEL